MNLGARVSLRILALGVVKFRAAQSKVPQEVSVLDCFQSRLWSWVPSTLVFTLRALEP